MKRARAMVPFNGNSTPRPKGNSGWSLSRAGFTLDAWPNAAALWDLDGAGFVWRESSYENIRAT